MKWERIVKGVLCWTGTPGTDAADDSAWTPYTAEELTARLITLSSAVQGAVSEHGINTDEDYTEMWSE